MIDSHCHLDFQTLASKIDVIIENSKKNNINSLLSINTHPNTFNSHLNLIKNYSGVYISYGFHPCEINSMEDLSILDFDKHCNNPYVVGIGETGIDLFHSSSLIKEQIKSFELHIEASIKYKLPLIIHQRNSENEIIKILNNYTKLNLNVVFHCFAGTKKLINFCLKNNYYISLSGIITFKNSSELRDVIKDYPLELLLIETDSPFLAPVPMRGKTNEPSYIKYTAEYLSNFYNLSFNEFETITDNNFFKLFNKTKRDNQL
tara:strand:- start:1414 stop:2196 length:783 start_codon:yes stop_codon:yes gene_type:complete